MTRPPAPAATPPDETLAVICTGLTASVRCIVDYDAAAKQIVRAAKPIHTKLTRAGTRLRQLVIGGPPALATAVDEATTNAVHVSAHYRSPIRYLDDTATHGSHGTIPSVRQDCPSIASVLADAGRPAPDSESIALSDADTRARVTPAIHRSLSPTRSHRAHEKAQSRQLEHLIGEWFDTAPTAEHVLILDDGRNTPDHLHAHLRDGTNPWVKYPSSAAGHHHQATL